MDTLHEDEAQMPRLDLNSMARGLLEELLNAVMDEQASELGAARNGYRERRLDTCVGAITLRIPKLREGTYFPNDIIEKWSRTDTALASAVCDMWAAGVSTRKVEKVMADMGVESMSRSRVSRLCAGLDAEVAELRGCDLSWQRWPYLWLDATYVPCREAGAARSTAVVTAVAAGEDGSRKVVGLGCADCESYMSWRGFLLGLRERGLSGVRLVTSDAHAGLARAIREVLAGAAWQRCIAHLERNVMERCRKKGDGAAAVAALKAAFGEVDPTLVEAGYAQAVESLAQVDKAGAELLEEARPFALNYLAFPSEHRSWIRTNNIQERMNAEIKRRTKVVQVFPSTASLVRLVGAVCCDQNDTWLVAKNFIDRRSLAEDYEPVPRQDRSSEIPAFAKLVQEAFDSKRQAA